MDLGKIKFVRFKECNSEQSWNSEQRYAARHRVRPTKFRITENLILDPREPFLQNWNRIILISCVLALALDPLFFYIPVIDVKRCLDSDNKAKIIASLLRTVIDAFYIFHIILQYRSGYIIPSNAFGMRRYSSLYFSLDILAILPIPQVVVFLIVPALHWPVPLMTKEWLKYIISGQCLPRIMRIYPLYKEFGVLHERPWAGAAFNLLLYMLASHVFGNFWYLLSIDKKVRCWQQECRRLGCDSSELYCSTGRIHDNQFLDTACPLVKPDDINNSTVFDFGIFTDALHSGMVETKDFSRKLFYCSWWGFRNLSSLGQNLKTSAFVGEIAFAFGIGVAGLVLFALLIGNMQKCLQSTTVTAEEIRVKRQDAEKDAEEWMLHRKLPEGLKRRIRQYEQYKWQEMRGVEEESFIRNLPKDLRRDIKRYLCLDLLMRVPLFRGIDEQLLDAMCDRLRPVLYMEKSLIVCEGDSLDEMLFINRGRLVTLTTNSGRTEFFDSAYLKAGDLCGEELLSWALDTNSSSNLPTSTRTVEAITEVEAFALTAYDLKFVASQFRRLHSKQFQYTVRYYSQQWRTWGACFIQATWRQHCKRKHDKALHDAQDRLHDALAKDGGASLSLAATVYASRFAAKALRNLRKSGSPKTPQRLPPLMPQKPAEPGFTADGSY